MAESATCCQKTDAQNEVCIGDRQQPSQEMLQNTSCGYEGGEYDTMSENQCIKEDREQPVKSGNTPYKIDRLYQKNTNKLGSNCSEQMKLDIFRNAL